MISLFIVLDNPIVGDSIADAVDPSNEFHEADHIEEMADEIFSKATEVTFLFFYFLPNSLCFCLLVLAQLQIDKRGPMIPLRPGWFRTLASLYQISGMQY